jgi:hypothetical protein
MTIVNLYCDGRAVLVATDTEAKSPTGGFHHITKVALIPHLQGVAAGTGSLWFLFMAFNMLRTIASPEEIPARLKWIRLFGKGQELAFACWDESKKKFRAWRYRGADGFAADEISEIASPWLDAWGEYNIRDPERMMVAARKQAAHLKARGDAGGGSLVLARLTHGMATVTSVPMDLR